MSNETLERKQMFVALMVLGGVIGLIAGALRDPAPSRASYWCHRLIGVTAVAISTAAFYTAHAFGTATAWIVAVVVVALTAGWLWLVQWFIDRELGRKHVGELVRRSTR